MIERTQKERELIADAERMFPTSTRCLTFDKDLNFCVAKAKGSHLWDVSGNEYIDYLLGSGPHVLGHAHPAVLEALRTIPENGTSFLIVNENAVALGKKIIEHVPCAEMVSLHSSGSEATFFALRLARVYRKRDKVLKFEGAYHGMHDYAMMSNQWTMGSAPFPQAVPNTHGIPRVLNDEVLIAPFNDLGATAEIISKHQDELAAVIIEPLQRTFEPKPGFLQGVREITANFDIPLIFDEVVTGFRMGLGGAARRSLRPRRHHGDCEPEATPANAAVLDANGDVLLEPRLHERSVRRHLRARETRGLRAPGGGRNEGQCGASRCDCARRHRCMRHGRPKRIRDLVYQRRALRSSLGQRIRLLQEHPILRPSTTTRRLEGSRKILHFDGTH
ncbi:MAG: aminotransferase class III-fold pyridoxal phosphate-dependent enzyme [Deltaproteobacteria bacterium]|nr:aminotransferase class III-fold pyridoxal phosphate-dependent enzyme [Deltaproteobacteria bacterium]